MSAPTLREAAQAVADIRHNPHRHEASFDARSHLEYVIDEILSPALAAATVDEVLDAAVLDAADPWERHCQLVGAITYHSQYVKAAALLDAVRARRRAQQEARDGSAV